eukprot:8759395-Pyramimonas_sp.AAC.1
MDRARLLVFVDTCYIRVTSARMLAWMMKAWGCATEIPDCCAAFRLLLAHHRARRGSDGDPRARRPAMPRAPRGRRRDAGGPRFVRRKCEWGGSAWIG